MQYRALHCWDCGVQVIGGTLGQHEPLSNFRQVKFLLSDGSYCESPFCATCADQPWTARRAKEFEQAVNRVSVTHQIRVMAVEGSSRLTDPMMGIVE